jgi:hypothetical protein
MSIPILLVWITSTSICLLLGAVGLGLVLYILVIRASRALTESDAVFISALAPNRLRSYAGRFLVFLLIRRSTHRRRGKRQSA